MEYRFRPIDKWPGERNPEPRRSPFRSQWGQTLDLLGRELFYLDAEHIVVQADCDDSQIRLDGMLRADAKLRSPGIILSFDSMHGPLKYPCDAFTHFHDNIRAIALALEALRKVDRYGVTRRAEQYTGWKALPDPNGSMSPGEAAEFIADHGKGDANAIGISPNVFRVVYKRAAKALHPDRTGDDELFKRLQEAKTLLERSFGG